jgi:thiaminase/transcriptional activator TenA
VAAAADADACSLFARLRTACGHGWNAFTGHPFVRLLAAGTLDEGCFRRYLSQDYLFLIHFARAYGLAAFKAETIEDIRAAARGLSAMIEQEMRLHIEYCRSWGLSEAEMAAAEEAAATLAYTCFVLERGLAGDLLDLQVALAPCILGYAEIGRALAADPSTMLAGNPYCAWIETYAGAEYQAVAAAHSRQMDELFGRRGSEARLPALATTFAQATRLETAFWQMGLDASAS